MTKKTTNIMFIKFTKNDYIYIFTSQKIVKKFKKYILNFFLLITFVCLLLIRSTL